MCCTWLRKLGRKRPRRRFVERLAESALNKCYGSTELSIRLTHCSLAVVLLGGVFNSGSWFGMKYAHEIVLAYSPPPPHMYGTPFSGPHLKPIFIEGQNIIRHRLHPLTETRRIYTQLMNQQEDGQTLRRHRPTPPTKWRPKHWL